MRTLATLCALTCLLLAPFAQAVAAVYKYTDESGRTVFVDSESRIPARYRNVSDQVQTTRPAAVQPVAEEEAGDTGEPKEPTASAEPDEPAARIITDRALEQRARQEAASLDRARAYQTPVVVRGGRVLVPVEVIHGGEAAHLMLVLDDNAPATIFYRNALQGLSFAPGEQTNLPGTGTRPVKGEKVLVGLIDIGPFELKDFPVALVTPQGGVRAFDGTLGMDFLKDHPYSVDYNREMLRWDPTAR